jgi:NAD(P)-dependent dehydrogenase (short-subunit alcohol dehydrogenase family)
LILSFLRAIFGRLDVVVNNPGFGDIAPFEQLSAERFKAVIDTNFYGVVNVTRAAVPHMRKQRSGCIIQISSVGGRLTRPGSTPYHAAKGPLEASRNLLPRNCPRLG